MHESNTQKHMHGLFNSLTGQCSVLTTKGIAGTVFIDNVSLMMPNYQRQDNEGVTIKQSIFN